MKVELVSVGTPQCTFVLRDLPAMLGRSQAADVFLDDAWIGEFQSIIEQHRGRLIVANIAGGLGTFVNGIPVTRTRLMPGDKLKVGSREFVVNYEQ